MQLFFFQFKSATGKAIISGHSDGSLVRYIFSEENTSETHVRTILFLNLIIGKDRKNDLK